MTVHIWTIGFNQIRCPQRSNFHRFDFAVIVALPKFSRNEPRIRYIKDWIEKNGNKYNKVSECYKKNLVGVGGRRNLWREMLGVGETVNGNGSKDFSKEHCE